MKIFKAISIVLFLSFLYTGCGGGGGDGYHLQEKTIPTISVSGTVLDVEGQPIERAEVTLSSDLVSVLTNINGTFTAEIEVGEHNITIIKRTAEIYSNTFQCFENTPLSLNTIMTPYIKSWDTAELIETDNSGTAVNPKVAIDTIGNAIAVWQQNDGERNNIWANRYAAGSGWDTAELIETDNSGSANKPQIAIDTTGNAISVWQQNDGEKNNIWANRYVIGSGWGTAELIETNPGNAEAPQIAIDTAGNAIVVWEQYIGTTYNIRANRYVIGSGWGTAELIETDDSGNAAGPQIAIDTSGNAIAVWQQSSNRKISIWGNRYVIGSGWGTAELIETNNSDQSYNPQVAIDRNSNAITVWYKNDSTEISIWANRYTVSSGWGTAERIEIESGRADDPQIAIDLNGNAIVVWKQYDGTKYNIWANRYTASAWGTAERIHSDSGTADSPRVAIDSNENTILLWKQYDGINYSIWANRYTASGWSTAEQIGTGNSGTASEPQVVMDTNGNAIAVWQQYDGERNNIWTNRFD